MNNKKGIRWAQGCKVALCYVRQSFTRNDDDMNSPERQRANIKATCERNGWTAEWYEDVGGHKSGRYEKNRPQWLALKKRLGDPDVIALVANDLSRFHRKQWRIGSLQDMLDEYGMHLVLAAPGREIDTSTPLGRMMLNFIAMQDEAYATDASFRAKDNIAYRKSQGKSIGRPPFGALRNEDGYLRPSTEGAWLLSNGQFVAGNTETDTPLPEKEACWRGYYDAAHYILNLYKSGVIGLEKIAYKFNQDGWAFRDRKGHPRMICRDDVRRVVSNWPEYGGIVVDKSGKDRPAYEKTNVDELPFNEERAIFPIKLLREIAKIRQERTVKPVDQSVKKLSRFYALSGITYCAHCEDLSAKHKNMKVRSLLSGNTTIKGVQRYRHKLGVKCGCTNRSVPCNILDAEFGSIVKTLEVKPETFDLMKDVAMQVDRARGNLNEVDIEKEKQEAITLCRRRIDAAVVLFGDGHISREEYMRRVQENQREIAHWQARTADIQKVAIEFAMCVEMVDRIVRLWDESDAEQKQDLVRSLFTQVTYDLDTQRIVDFKLKPWAERFVVSRAALYKDGDDTPDDGENGTGSEPVSERNDVGHMPLWGTSKRPIQNSGWAFCIHTVSPHTTRACRILLPVC
jgi:DNA invertase Pin-like site-specific DNA recombinase